MYRVSDKLSAKLEALLPKYCNPKREGRGRPRVPDRQALDGVLFVFWTGCQRNAFSETGNCSSSTAPRRFQQWRDVTTGVFRKLWRKGLLEYDSTRSSGRTPRRRGARTRS